MAAGDMALQATLTAIDAMSPVVEAAAANFDAAIGSMEGSTVTLSGSLDGLDTSLASLDAVSAGTDASLAGIDVASASADASLGGLDGSLAAADAALSGFAATEESTAATMSMMGVSLDTVDASMAEMSAMTTEGAAAASAMDGSLGGLDASLASIDGAASAADAALSSLDGVATGVDGSFAALQVQVAELQAQVAELQAELAALEPEEEAAAGASMGMALALGAVVIGAGIAGGAAIKMAGDFQAGLTTLATGAGEAQNNLAMVGDGIKQIALDTGTSTKQLISGMYMIESSGQHGAAGLEVLRVAAEGAKVGNADLGAVANALTTVLTDYHMKASDAASAMNALTATVASGKTHLQDLATSMGSVLPLASALHLSFPQVAGAIATMTNAGMDARRASMNLANAIRSLAAPNATAVKSMKSVGLTAQQLKDTLSHGGLTGALQLIEQHVGRTFPANSVAAVTAFKNIMGGATGYNVSLMLGGKNMKNFEGNVKTITAAMKGGKGAVTGWSAVQGDFNTQIDRAKAAVEVLAINVGQQLLPPLTKIVGAITPILTRFITWISQGNNLQTMLAVVGGVLAGFAVIIGALVVPAIISMGAAFLSMEIMGAPILAVVLAVIAVVTIIILVIQHWGQIVGWLKGVWSAFSSWFGGVMSAIGTFFHGVWNGIASFFVGVWNGIVNFFKAAWNVIVTVAKIVGIALFVLLTGPIGLLVLFIITHWTQVKTFLAGVWNGIVTIARTAWSALVNAITAPIKAIVGWFLWLYNHNYYFKALVDFIKNIFTNAKGFIINLWTTIVTWLVNKWNGLKNFVGTVFSAIGTFIFDKLTWIATIWQNIWDAIGTWIRNYLTNLKNYYGNIFSAIGTLVHDKIMALATWLYGIWEQVRATITSKLTALQTTFGNIFSAIGTAVHQKITDLWSWLTGFVSGWPAQAFNWGVNLIQGLINGIKNMIGGVINTVKNIAGAIGNFLGFHSPAKEGPGKDADKWAPAFINMYVAGLKAGIPKVNAAFAGLASPQQKQAFALGSNTATGAGYNTANVTIQLDSRVLAETVGIQLAKETRINGYRAR